VRDFAQVRLRQPGPVAERGRRPGIDRRPDHQRGQMPAAEQQAAARRDQELQRLSRRRARHLARRRRDSRAGTNRARRYAAGAGSWIARLSICARRRARFAPRRRRYGAALRLLSLQPLQHQHAAPDGGDVRAGIRVDCTLSRRSRRVELKPMSDENKPGMKSEAFDARELLKSLPNRAGVYRMVDAAGETLYVGKARDLKKRVSNYFQKTEHHPRTEAMVAQVARVEVTVTRSEGEALLLEDNLIKAHQPRYNVVFRDDKSYPFICLTGETFPQLRFHRGKLDKPHRYF